MQRHARTSFHHARWRGFLLRSVHIARVVAWSAAFGKLGRRGAPGRCARSSTSVARPERAANKSFPVSEESLRGAGDDLHIALSGVDSALPSSSSHRPQIRVEREPRWAAIHGS